MILNNKTSAVVFSSASNFVMTSTSPFTKTFRSYFKPREYGRFNWSFWHSNSVDSTWDLGMDSRANIEVGEFIINSASLADGGTTPNGSIVHNSQIAITFNGKPSKKVLPNEAFYSDSVAFEIPENHYVCFTWTISSSHIGKVLPYNTEDTLVSSYSAEGDFCTCEDEKNFSLLSNCLVFPSMFCYEKQVSNKIAFFGDSITQGVRTKRDAYEYWVSKIADGLGTDYGIWNLGSGWARAYDAATDGSWLNKAKKSDEIIICLGVNDLDIGKRNSDEIISDLTTIVSKLKENNPLCKVILFTVPPFDFADDRETYRTNVNNAILNNPPKGTDRVFDVAKVLYKDTLHQNLVNPKYKSAPTDPHPNGLAGSAIAKEFLKWY